MSRLHQNILMAFAFFIAIIVFASVFILPKIEEILEKQFQQTIEEELALEETILVRFFDDYRVLLQDLAIYSFLEKDVVNTNDHTAILDRLRGYSATGKKAEYAMLDITGGMLFKSKNFRGMDDWRRSERFADDIDSILDEYIGSYFQLLGQAGDVLMVRMGVPVKKDGEVKAIFVAELHVPVHYIFPKSLSRDTMGIRLKQDQVVVQTDIGGITVPYQKTRYVDSLDLHLTYVMDLSVNERNYKTLEQRILFTIGGGIVLSFVTFFLVNYFGFFAYVRSLAGGVDSRLYVLPISVLLLGLMVSLTAYQHAGDISAERKREDGILHAQSFSTLFKQAMEFNLLSIDGLNAFFGASNYVDEEEFATFTYPFLERIEYTDALYWLEKKDDGGFGLKYTAGALLDKYDMDTLLANEDFKRWLKDGYYLEIFVFATEATHDEDALFIARRIFDSKERLMGVVLLKVDMLQFLEDVFGDETIEAGVHLRAAGKYPKDIYAKPIPFAEDGVVFFKTLFPLNGELFELEVQFLNGSSSVAYMPLMVLVITVMFTLMLTLLLVQMLKRRNEVEHLVSVRTMELEESENFQKLILENNPDLIFVKDSDYKIVSANPAFMDLYPEEMRDNIIGHTTFESYDPEAVEAFLRDDKIAFEEGYRDVVETITFPNNATHTYYTQKIRFENADGNAFILCIGRDVTERENLMQRLIASNEELENFAYTASHDLQEPLRMVVSFTKILIDKYSDLLDDKGKKYLNISSESAQRMQVMVEDLLEYARVSQSAERYEIIDGEKTLSYIKDSFNTVIEEANATIIHDPLPNFVGNPVRFSRLMQNLIGNGMKYQPEGNVPEIHIKVAENAHEWVFSVADNGIGMRKEYCEKIFLPFSRLNSREEYEGTGIGLAICKKLVESWGGKIWAESELGEGSTFFFTVPKHASEKTMESDTVL